MRIGRTIPPAAAPIEWKNIAYGILGAFRGDIESKRFVAELKEYYEKKYCFLVSSGKTALTIILQALKHCYPERNKVLIPAYTCYSVPSAVKRAGLDLVLCDISNTGLDFDFKRLEPLLVDEKLLCIIPTHLYGIPADVAKLRKMLNDSHVVIVEDAAQAMGSCWQGQKLGTLGDVSFFSLSRGKAYSTVEGGIILTDREDIGIAISEQYRCLPSYSAIAIASLLIYAVALKVLIHPMMYWLPRGLPFLRLGETIYDPNFKMRKLSNFQSGLSVGWLEQLDMLRTKRNKNAMFWREIEAIIYTSLVPEIKALPDMLRFPIKVLDKKARARMLDEGEQLGLGLAEGYPDAIAGISELSEQFRGQSYPRARTMAEQIVTLPLHSLLSKKDLNRIKQSIALC
jgi:perosamine synthetase